MTSVGRGVSRHFLLSAVSTTILRKKQYGDLFHPLRQVELAQNASAHSQPLKKVGICALQADDLNFIVEDLGDCSDIGLSVSVDRLSGTVKSIFISGPFRILQISILKGFPFETEHHRIIRLIDAFLSERRVFTVGQHLSLPAVASIFPPTSLAQFLDIAQLNAPHSYISRLAEVLDVEFSESFLHDTDGDLQWEHVAFLAWAARIAGPKILWSDSPSLLKLSLSFKTSLKEGALDSVRRKHAEIAKMLAEQTAALALLEIKRNSRQVSYQAAAFEDDYLTIKQDVYQESIPPHIKSLRVYVKVENENPQCAIVELLHGGQRLGQILKCHVSITLPGKITRIEALESTEVDVTVQKWHSFLARLFSGRSSIPFGGVFLAYAYTSRISQYFRCESKIQATKSFADSICDRDADSFPKSGLNSSQRFAILHAVSKHQDTFKLIRTPPATGKTVVIAGIVKTLLHSHPGHTVVVLGASNRSVADLVSSARDSDITFYKWLVGRNWSEWHDTCWDSYRNHIVHEPKLCEGPLLFLTVDMMLKSGFIHSLGESSESITLLIDDASRVPIVKLLLLLSCLPEERLQNITLFGDSSQLGPHIEQDLSSLTTSFQLPSPFELPALKSRAVLLNVQYRLPAICGEAFDLFCYGSRLQSGPNVSHEAYLTAVNSAVGSETGDERSFRNKYEAQIAIAVLQHVQHLRPDIATVILTPYTAQKDLIRRELVSMNVPLAKSLVFTIDGFQDEKRDVVILSLVRNRISDKNRFLFDPRRANVALSRHNIALVIIADSLLMDDADNNMYRQHIAFAEVQWQRVDGAIIAGI